MKRTRLKPGKPLTRKTPLKRHNWFKSTRPGPRTSPEYKAAVLEAFEPYMVGEYYCRCAFCGVVYPLNEVAPCHIFHKGGCEEMFCEPLDILPGDFKCHGNFDKKSTEARRRQIEKILPGRWEELEELRVKILEAGRGRGGEVDTRRRPVGRTDDLPDDRRGE